MNTEAAPRASQGHDTGAAHMVGNDLRLDEGIGTCGKDGQAVPVGVGMPTTKLDRMTVGGTARKDPGGFMQ